MNGPETIVNAFCPRYAAPVARRRASSIQAEAGRRRREATQDAILEATKRLLQSGAPLAALSVERIVAEAGVGRTTFYLHFGDKRGLMQRLAQDEVEWFAETGVAGGSVDPELTRETVRRTVAAILDHWVANHAVLSAIIEFAEYDEAMHETWRGAIGGVGLAAAGVFQSYWKGGPATPRHPEAVGEIVIWMMERAFHQLGRDRKRRDEVEDSVTEIIWRLLHPPLV